MCFKPKNVQSQKEVLVELDKAKILLEQENAALRLKVKGLQDSAISAAKEKDTLSCQRSKLEAQLRERSSYVASLLTKITCLRSNFNSHLQEVLDQHIAGAATRQDDPVKPRQQPPTTVNVHVLEPECIDNEHCSPGAGTTLGPEVPPDPKVASPAPAHRAKPQDNKAAKVSNPQECDADALNSSDGCKLSVEQQLDRQLELLTDAHNRAVHEAEQLQARLLQAEGDRTGLHADVAGARRRLEQTEANAADQQQVLQLRCAALEQENEQLTGMSQEMQQRLEKAEMELSTAKKNWNADTAQLSKQAADLESANGRLREAEAEIRSVQAQVVVALAEAQEANAKALELQAQVSSRAAALEASGAALAAREADLTIAQDGLQQLRQAMQQLETQVIQRQKAQEALATEVRELTESRRQVVEALEASRGAMAEMQRELTAAQQLLAAQSQALADAQAQLMESRAAVATTGDRLNHALEELAGNEARLSEANAQYLNTKQSVISTAKQLASMAKDHSVALAKLHALEAEAAILREQLAAARDAEAALRPQAEASSAAARAAREAAEAATAEALRLRAAYDGASADLRRKIMLLTAIARMADKGGQAAAGGARTRDAQAADPADSYGAVTSEQRLRLKICESPLPLLGALTAGIMDSSRLRNLALDMDTSREVTWEKAGLRICCLAAAIGLNNSLQTLQLSGWTWGELGNGTALPFLALGGGGASGAGGMLRSVRLATNLFDVEAAAMLKDLWAAGLVDLAAGAEGDEEGGQRPGEGSGGQGVLRLYSGNERLDGWYRDMLLLNRQQQQQGVRSTTPPGSVRISTAGSLSVASDDLRTSASVNSTTAGNTTAAATATAAPSPPPEYGTSVDCDLSSEALESHHMVLVMTVLLTCPVLRRLKLDGNKLGDGGIALLALGLSANTGLRELYLSRNGIRAAGARSLARCLEGANSTLLRLDLSGQRLEGLGVAGAEALAQALRVNRTLEELNLASCGIAGAAAGCFAGAIRAAGAVRPAGPATGGESSRSSSAGSGGGSLRRLVLSGNAVDAGTAKMLLAAAAERPGMTLSM